MDTFWRMLEKSTLTSGLIALTLVFVASYCTIAQIPMPDYLAVALGTVVGFFFTSKAKDGEIRNVADRLKDERRESNELRLRLIRNGQSQDQDPG